MYCGIDEKIKNSLEIRKKVDFELSYSPFLGFSTKILLLYSGFPLTRFLLGPKNRVKGGVPVYKDLCNDSSTI